MIGKYPRPCMYVTHGIVNSYIHLAHLCPQSTDNIYIYKAYKVTYSIPGYCGYSPWLLLEPPKDGGLELQLGRGRTRQLVPESNHVS